MGRLNKNATPQ